MTKVSPGFRLTLAKLGFTQLTKKLPRSLLTFSKTVPAESPENHLEPAE
jgi:hypothetical protein